MEKVSAEKRLEILGSAMKLFSERGFDRTTVDEIASRANVGKGTVYLYFENKEQIFLAIFEEGLEQIYRFTTKILEEDSSIQEKLRKLVFAHLKFIEDNKEFYKIFLKERLNLRFCQSDDSRNRLMELHRKLQEQIVNFFKQGMEEKCFRTGDPDAFSCALSGIVTHNAFHWIIEDHEGELTAKTDEIMEIFLHGVANYNVSKLEVS